MVFFPFHTDMIFSASKNKLRKTWTQPWVTQMAESPEPSAAHFESKSWDDAKENLCIVWVLRPQGVPLSPMSTSFDPH